MNRIKAVFRKLYLFALVWGMWFAVEGVAWAKKPETVEKDSGKASDWVLSYFLVILCLTLGMLVVCRTSRRSERARPQGYEGLKTKD